MRERMIRDIAESFIREVIGARILDDVLTKEKQAIQTEVRKGLQDKMNALSTGVFVSSISLQDVIPPQAVQKAFNAVNSARAEKERMILEAERYAKEIASEMAGDVERILNEANAYAFRRVALAEGDVARLSALNEAYRVDPDLVKLNLWMETMTDVWKEINPLFLRSSESLKFLPLDRFIEPSEKDAKGD
jgi:membrane protease subunit HflK